MQELNLDEMFLSVSGFSFPYGELTVNVNAITLKAFAEKVYQAQQAKIDSLMLEFCPEEMTEEQLKVWGENQKSVKEPGNPQGKF